jgi:hypothetical protein
MAMTVMERWQIVRRAIEICKHFSSVPDRGNVSNEDIERAAQAAAKIELFIKYSTVSDPHQLLFDVCKALGVDVNEVRRLLAF